MASRSGRVHIRFPMVMPYPSRTRRPLRDRSPAPPTGGIMTTATTAVSAQRAPELLGQTVVVIGGSAGIGLETARRARAEGASVILTGRNPERLKQAALELDAQRTAAFDANDPASLQSFFQDLPTPIDHVNPTLAEPTTRDTRASARTLGVQLHVVSATTDNEIDDAFASLANLRAGGLVIAGDQLFSSRIERLGSLAVRYAVPAI